MLYVSNFIQCNFNFELLLYTTLFEVNYIYGIIHIELSKYEKRIDESA
jgi:hypothetical protein